MATIGQIEPKGIAETSIIRAQATVNNLEKDEKITRGTRREKTSILRTQTNQGPEVPQTPKTVANASNDATARELKDKAEAQELVPAKTATRDRQLPKPFDPNRGTRLDIAV